MPPHGGHHHGGGHGGHHGHGGSGWRGGPPGYWAEPSYAELVLTCPEVYDPVLATDGRVYDSPCLAQGAGVAVVKRMRPRGLNGIMDNGDPTALLSTILTLPASAIGADAFYTRDPVTTANSMNAVGYAVSAAAWLGLGYLLFHKRRKPLT